MSRFADQNGPFCDVKRLILKNALIFLSFLSVLFTVSERITPKKRSKILTRFFGNNSLQFCPYRHITSPPFFLLCFHFLFTPAAIRVAYLYHAKNPRIFLRHQLHRLVVGMNANRQSFKVWLIVTVAEGRQLPKQPSCSEQYRRDERYAFDCLVVSLFFPTFAEIICEGMPLWTGPSWLNSFGRHEEEAGRTCCAPRQQAPLSTVAMSESRAWD